MTLHDESVVDRSALVERAATLISETPTGTYQSRTEKENTFAEFCEIFEDYSVETLRRLLVPEMSYNDLSLIIVRLRRGWTEENLNDFLHLELDIKGYELTSHVSDMIEWLVHYEGLTPQNDGKYPAARTSEVNTIIGVLIHMYRQNVDMWVNIFTDDGWEELYLLHDEKLLALILSETPVNRKSIVELATKRDLYDADRIKELLDSATPILLEGAL